MWVPQPTLTRKPVKGEAPGWAAKLCERKCLSLGSRWSHLRPRARLDFLLG